MERTDSSEIDLIRILAHLFILCKKNKWIIITSVFISILFWVYRLSSTANPNKTFYTKQYTLHSTIKPKVLIVDILNNLSAQQTTAISKNFKTIKSNLIITEDREDALIKLQLEVYDKDSLDAIMKDVLNYIENNDYVKNEFEKENEQNKKLLAKLNSQIISIENKNVESAQKGLIELHYPELVKEKLLVEQKLKLKNAIEIIVVDETYKTKSNLDILLLNFILSILLGSVLGLVICILIAMKKGDFKNMKITIEKIS